MAPRDLPWPARANRAALGPPDSQPCMPVGRLPRRIRNREPKTDGTRQARDRQSRIRTSVGNGRDGWTVNASRAQHGTPCTSDVVWGSGQARCRLGFGLR